MAEQSSRSRLTWEDVLVLLDEEEEDGMDGNFFTGSDEAVMKRSMMQRKMKKTVLQGKIKKTVMQGKK